MTTSDAVARPTECFVYIQLPGSLDVVACGRYALERRSDGTTLGRFVYGRSYRENAREVAIEIRDFPTKGRNFGVSTVRRRRSGVYAPVTRIPQR